MYDIMPGRGDNMTDNEGQEILNESQFDTFIEGKSDRKLLEFLARQTYQQNCQISNLNIDLKATKRMTLLNRVALTALVIVLITLGIIDGSLLPLLSLSPLVFLF
jgi:hypothetical protein